MRYGEKNLPRITISGGVAHAQEHGAVPQDLLRVADDALYEAKPRGRNQIVVASLQAEPADAEAAADAEFARQGPLKSLPAAQ